MDDLQKFVLLIGAIVIIGAFGLTISGRGMLLQDAMPIMSALATVALTAAYVWINRKQLIEMSSDREFRYVKEQLDVLYSYIIRNENEISYPGHVKDEIICELRYRKYLAGDKLGLVLNSFLLANQNYRDANGAYCNKFPRGDNTDSDEYFIMIEMGKKSSEAANEMLRITDEEMDDLRMALNQKKKGRG